MVRYKNDIENEVIDYHHDTYSDDVLLEMIEELSLLDFTINEFRTLNLFNENLNSISGEIIKTTDIDRETEVLESFIVEF